VAIDYWGSMAAVGRRRGRGERVLQGLASGSSSSFDPTRYDKGERVLKIFRTPERDPSRSFFTLLVGFAKEIGERETWQS
jgi:hypothetical protein